MQIQPAEGFKYVNAEFHGNGWTGLFEEYADQLENACLCMAHVTSEFEMVARELKTHYPHLMVLPSSHGETLKLTLSSIKDIMDEIDGEESIYWNVLGNKDIDRFADSAELADELKARLYKIEYPAESWRALIEIAHKMVMERKKHN